jgi:hypothetical protein
MANWRQIADRVRQMERAELRFRIRQECSKRQDRWLNLLGWTFPGTRRLLPGVKPGTFFFSPADIADRIRLLCQRLPEQANQIVRRAERLVQHRFDHLGYTDLSYGSPIDWHLDPVHGKRAPKKAFYRVQYLDFDEVGDSKIIWELNRHQHFVILAKAYRLTGDTRFVDEILRQWRHWWAENPYPMGINWASSLEVAFRSLSWLWTVQLLEGASGLPDFRGEWLRGLALHGRHIERYLSTYFSPNTHLLGEGVGLFFLGALCPELPDAERWKQSGWKIVQEEARRQVRADGFHFEQSTYYHVYALDFFLHAAVLANLNNIAVLKEFEETLERMLVALQVLGRGGAPPRFGDDDGGRLFDPRRNGSEHLLDPLSTGAILFHRGDFKAAAASLREETIWLLGREGVSAWDELEASPAKMNSAALREAGFYLLSADKPKTQLAVDCGPIGADSGGHGHADLLSITLESNGQALLIDPGTGEYVGDGGDRNLFRGTSMHNTITVDGVSQASPATAFSWASRPHPNLEQWVDAPDFDYFMGSHDGYARLAQPVTHRRSIFSLKNGFYLVRDVIEGKGRHQLEISWHLNGELQLIEDGLFRLKHGSAGFAVLPTERHGWAEEFHRQAWSPVYGQKAPMNVLKFFSKTEVPATFCCAIVRLEEVQIRPGILTEIERQAPDSAVSAYSYSSPKEHYTFCFGGAGTECKEWKCGAITSDAEVVCWTHFEDGAGDRVILLNGTKAEVPGVPSLRFRRSVTWGELIMNRDERRVLSSDSDAVIEDSVISTPRG